MTKTDYPARVLGLFFRMTEEQQDKWLDCGAIIAGGGDPFDPNDLSERAFRYGLMASINSIMYQMEKSSDDIANEVEHLGDRLGSIAANISFLQ